MSSSENARSSRSRMVAIVIFLVAMSIFAYKAHHYLYGTQIVFVGGSNAEVGICPASPADFSELHFERTGTITFYDSTFKEVLDVVGEKDGSSGAKIIEYALPQNAPISTIGILRPQAGPRHLA